jgi:hypothetical protein
VSLQRHQAAEHSYFAEFHHVPALVGVISTLSAQHKTIADAAAAALSRANIKQSRQ